MESGKRGSEDSATRVPVSGQAVVVLPGPFPHSGAGRKLSRWRRRLSSSRLRPRAVLLGGAALLVACDPGGGGESACRGLSEKQVGIRREEHLPCADAIVASLDTLRAQLEAVLEEDTTALDRARTTAGGLRRHLREAGLEADARSLRPGAVVERWPDGEVRAFNEAAMDAAFHYSTFLGSRFDRTSERLEEGVRAHDRVRRAHARLR